MKWIKADCQRCGDRFAVLDAPHQNKTPRFCPSCRLDQIVTAERRRTPREVWQTCRDCEERFCYQAMGSGRPRVRCDVCTDINRARDQACRREQRKAGRTVTIAFSLTPEEYAVWQLRARTAGLTVGAYIYRQACLKEQSSDG